MPITSKGTRWERMHSLWIVWTFTLGFFNWIAFFYIGVRARHRRWILWGLFYSVPFILLMLFTDTKAKDSWQMNVAVFLIFTMGPGSIIHAFNRRSEYLLRLEALQLRQPREEAALKNQIARELGLSARSASTDLSNQTVHASVAADAKLTPVDINNDPEQAIAALPGIGPILAKKVVSLRQSRGGFSSIEDFAEALALKPHIVERIKPLVVITPIQQSQPSQTPGRVLDF